MLETLHIILYSIPITLLLLQTIKHKKIQQILLKNKEWKLFVCECKYLVVLEKISTLCKQQGVLRVKIQQMIEEALEAQANSPDAFHFPNS